MSNTKTCVCGKSFEGRSNKQFCSGACKLRAFRMAQKAETSFDEVSITSSLPLRRSPSRSTFATDRSSVTALKYQAGTRKAELAHKLELERMRLTAQERARELEVLRLAPPPPPPPPQLTPEEQYRANQAAREEQERLKRDAHLDERYEELTHEFLALEGQNLPSGKFSELVDDLQEHEVDYRKHSGLRNSSLITKRRLDFLDEMQEVLRDTLNEIADQTPPLFGQRKGGFALKKKWRASLRDSLLAR